MARIPPAYRLPGPTGTGSDPQSNNGASRFCALYERVSSRPGEARGLSRKYGPACGPGAREAHGLAARLRPDHLGGGARLGGRLRCPGLHSVIAHTPGGVASKARQLSAWAVLTGVHVSAKPRHSVRPADVDDHAGGWRGAREARGAFGRPGLPTTRAPGERTRDESFARGGQAAAKEAAEAARLRRYGRCGGRRTPTEIRSLGTCGRGHRRHVDGGGSGAGGSAQAEGPV